MMGHFQLLVMYILMYTCGTLADASNAAVDVPPPSKVADAELQARIEKLQKELDELKALARQRYVQTAAAPPATSATGKAPSSPLNPLTLGTPSKFRFSGYIQARAFDDQTTTNAPSRTDQFNVRRARLEFSGETSRTIAGRLTFDVGGNTGAGSLRDAYIDVKTKPAVFRAGQWKLPFNYEIPQSESENAALETTLASQRLFPSGRERGVMADFDLKKRPGAQISFQIGAFNGVGANQADNNVSKDLFATLFYNTPGLQVRVSNITGGFNYVPAAGGGAPFRTTKRRFGVTLRTVQGPWDFHGQFIRGHGDSPTGGAAPLLTGTLGPTAGFNNSDVQGWYVMALRKLKIVPLSIWGRFEQFDPNTDASGDVIGIGALGGLWDFTPQVRFTAGVFRKAFRTSSQKTTVGLQTQVRF